MDKRSLFNHYNSLVEKDIYVYKNGASNILFIGGCRSYAYAIYFEELCKNISWFTHAQYGLAVIGVHIIELLKRNKTKNMINVIENADIIICEQIRRYDFLNTSLKCEANIFNNFNIKKDCKIIQIPNLEFNYEINECNKKYNLTRFIEHCNKYEFTNLSNYILNNIDNIPLFISFNHPSSILLTELIKELSEKYFQYKITEPEVLNILSNIIIFK